MAEAGNSMPTAVDASEPARRVRREISVILINGSSHMSNHLHNVYLSEAISIELSTRILRGRTASRAVQK
jgi:hypothetical protein